MIAKEYKSSVLSMLMQEPKYALDVYNTINGSAYSDPNLVEVILLENSFFMQ